MLAPLSVNVPAPCLFSPPLPPTTPANAVLVASPVVSVFAPSVTVVPATPVSEPTVSLAPKVRLAPNTLRFTASVSASAVLLVSASEPAATVVVPV